MIGAATFDWATPCGDGKARTSKTVIRRPRRPDKKSFIWLDTPKKQRMFSEEEKSCLDGYRDLPIRTCIIRHSERITGDSESTGINRHVVGDARALQERK